MDWMTRILQLDIFSEISPQKIQSLFMRVEEISASEGDVIVKEGDEGEYFYIIKKGRCKVTKNPKIGPELRLNTLNEGDSFGEDALLSNDRRNANVIMLTDGSLMRLSKEDFTEFLQEPVLRWVSYQEAKALVKDGARWIDVRLRNEYKGGNIRGSINIPLFLLRLRIADLDREPMYIVYCDTGDRSSVGAFILNERGFKACCLKGGLHDYR